MISLTKRKEAARKAAKIAHAKEYGDCIAEGLSEDDANECAQVAASLVYDRVIDGDE
ncbi:hypothetical protein [Phyllobacterium phragmitis]|nr:hypothetical protein [Phyllobacterium phragmitis]